MTKQDIARAEGIREKVVRVAIERGLWHLEKNFEKFFVRRTDLDRKMKWLMRGKHFGSQWPEVQTSLTPVLPPKEKEQCKKMSTVLFEVFSKYGDRFP